MYGENLRKFTETRARAALAPCSNFFATKNTVQLSIGVYTATSDRCSIHMLRMVYDHLETLRVYKIYIRIIRTVTNL
jgi:hypothetical protein